MASFTNQNYITDNDPDEVDTKNTKMPKKTIVSSFELVHPTVEEEIMKQIQTKEQIEASIEKSRKERVNKYTYLLYGASVLGLFFFSYKRWFPLLRSPF